VYADQIEYMHRNLARRDSVILSVHPHNDRGTGVACAELAVLAVAETRRGLHFRQRRAHRQCRPGDARAQPARARHRARAAETGVPAHELDWRVPYLPIDPADLGRDYAAVIRVNLQSGKGGIAYLMESEYGITLPRRLQIDFARRVQDHTDGSGQEVTATELWQLFAAAYLQPNPAITLSRSENSADEHTGITLRVDGIEHTSTHTGTWPVEALTAALGEHGRKVGIVALHQTNIGSGNDSGTQWTAGRDRSVLAASPKAVVNAA
jgi:2-isopropylmalate synthase